MTFIYLDFIPVTPKSTTVSRKVFHMYKNYKLRKQLNRKPKWQLRKEAAKVVANEEARQTFGDISRCSKTRQYRKYNYRQNMFLDKTTV